MALYADSEIVIGMHTHLKFIGNHANHFGGAIYVDNANPQVFSTFNFISCFYKLVDIVNTSIRPHVVMENNSADYAGSGLYGGSGAVEQVNSWGGEANIQNTPH